MAHHADYEEKECKFCFEPFWVRWVDSKPYNDSGFCSARCSRDYSKYIRINSEISKQIKKTLLNFI